MVLLWNSFYTKYFVLSYSIDGVFTLSCHLPTYDAYDVTDRGPDGPCDQISAGFQVLVVELSYTLSLLPWDAHAWDRRLGLSSSSASQL